MMQLLFKKRIWINMRTFLLLCLPAFLLAENFPPDNSAYYEMTQNSVIQLDVSYQSIDSVWSNRPDYVTVSLSEDKNTVTITTRGNVGYASFSYNTQYGTQPASYGGTYGVVVEKTLGSKPGLPSNLSIGSRAFFTPGSTDAAWWGQGGQGSNQARWTDIIDIYMPNGPYQWVTQNSDWDKNWYPGKYLANFIQGCKTQGRIPCVVFYCIPAAGVPDSALGDLKNVSSSSYMNSYYNITVRVMREIIWQNSQDGWPVLVVIEPDFIGYMTQTIQADPNDNPIKYPKGSETASSYTVQVNTILQNSTSPLPSSPPFNVPGKPLTNVSTYPLLTDADPSFPNTLYGLVTSIPYVLKKQFTDIRGNANAQWGSNVKVGWKMNLWASPPGGFAGNSNKINGVPFGVSKGLCRWTDVCYPDQEKPYPLSEVVDLFTQEVEALAKAYYSFGITENCDFFAVDRYGRDGATYGKQGTYLPNVYDGAINPTASDISWCWNSDHWYNYLTFVKTAQATVASLLKQQGENPLPVLLWQIPVGHLNNSLAVSPSTGRVYTPLGNAYGGSLQGDYEDAAQTFIYGDTFNPGAWPSQDLGVTRAGFFSKDLYNQFASPSSGVMTWRSHLQDFVDAGVFGIVAAPGLGTSVCTFGVSQTGLGPFDFLWWIEHTQGYYQKPISLKVPAP